MVALNECKKHPHLWNLNLRRERFDVIHVYRKLRSGKKFRKILGSFSEIKDAIHFRYLKEIEIEEEKYSVLEQLEHKNFVYFSQDWDVLIYDRMEDELIAYNRMMEPLHVGEGRKEGRKH
jgi:hypothetical protein